MRRWYSTFFNTMRLRQNGRHFPDNIFKCFFFNENVWISDDDFTYLVIKGPINNITALVQIMAWHWPGKRLVSEPMMLSLLMHICVTRPLWINGYKSWIFQTRIYLQTGYGVAITCNCRNILIRMTLAFHYSYFSKIQNWNTSNKVGSLSNMVQYNTILHKA